MHIILKTRTSITAQIFEKSNENDDKYDKTKVVRIKKKHNSVPCNSSKSKDTDHVPSQKLLRPKAFCESVDNANTKLQNVTVSDDINDVILVIESCDESYLMLSTKILISMKLIYTKYLSLKDFRLKATKMTISMTKLKWCV